MSPSDDEDSEYYCRTSNGSGEGDPSSTNRMRKGKVMDDILGVVGMPTSKNVVKMRTRVPGIVTVH